MPARKTIAPAPISSTVADVGQLLIIGFDGTEITPRLSSLLKRLQPAGVILFARNIKTPEQTWKILDDCQRCVGTPLFRCVDLEGGSVDRFRDALGSSPSAAEVFQTASRKLYRRHGQIIGENCRALGFNVDFAPVLDLAFEPSREVMGSRTVSPDPRDAVTYAREFLSGLSQCNILGCGKHFPGLGEGKLDSHHKLPVIAKPLKQMWSEDLAPYRSLRKQLPFIMVAHAAYPQVTRERMPASLSRFWISDILWKRIGFRNLIVSDDLEMGAVLSAAPIGDAAVEFIRAGGHLCLVCHREDRVIEVYEALIRSVERDRKFAQRVAEAAKRVRSFKKKCSRGLRASAPPSADTTAKLTRQLWEFSEQIRLDAFSRREDKRSRS